MAFNDTSKINISLKKLSGKAHTSNDKGLANEGLSSGITQASSTIFGDYIIILEISHQDIFWSHRLVFWTFRRLRS